VRYSGVAVTTPPATSLALTEYPHMTGTASSLLGLARFPFGGVAAPLIGLGGADDALPLGMVTVVSMTLAVGADAALVRRGGRAGRAHSPASAHRTARGQFSRAWTAAAKSGSS
jgi:DHA1 family bicyclomycin/chloramphenicol resistance-like MFS transporter